MGGCGVFIPIVTINLRAFAYICKSTVLDNLIESHSYPSHVKVC